MIIIKPTNILSTRSWRPKNPLYQEPSYDRATTRLWRGAGIGITIFAIWFLLKEFKVL